ncbi:MAG TPA: hypothetical protein VKU40_12090, partial [Thermoanaerobaculia bacterium]|nr:hypothetical protein [Thermoanaerobaculia bacterium]
RPGWKPGLAAVVLVLAWANLHSGVVFGLFLVALFALEALVADRRRLPAWIALGTACGLAALVNPNGFEALLYPFRLAALLGDPESGFTAGHFTGGWRGPQALLGLLALATLAGWLLRLRQRDEDDRDPRAGLPGAWLLAVAVFAALSWKSDRLALEFAALAVPAVHALWTGWATRRGGWPKPVALGAPLLALAFSLLFAVGVLWARPPGVVSPAFPSGAVEWLETNGIEGRMFNHQNWGAYLYWNLREPIFWDGRNDVFAPVVREVVSTPFHEVADKYGIGTLVLSRREFQDLQPELASGRWRGVYADDRAAIFVRR